MFTNDVMPLGSSIFNLTPDKEAQEQFLYIGSAQFFSSSLAQQFPHSLQASSLEEAKLILLEAAVSPDMIIIDVLHNHIQLVGFRVWLLEHLLNKIPLIYNQSYLATEETKLLFKQKLVDDVINLHQHYHKLGQKLKFFKKLNSDTTEAAEKKAKLPSSCRFCFVKRGFDILIALTGIALTLPVMLIIALIIKIDSKGPVFYFAKRAGRGFKIFNFYKFRTMIVDADQKIKELATDLNQYDVQAKGPVFIKLNNDPRITKFGKFLRNSSLDELPQLFNVLKGDMSIVGNRPLPLYEASTLTTAEWAERFMAPAGITGLWQVSKRGQKEMSNEERIQLDIEYARSRNLLTDFKILLKTPAALFQNADV